MLANLPGCQQTTSKLKKTNRMIHEISLLNRLLADLTIQSISSKSYANPHIVGKANPTPKTPIKKNLFLGGFIYNRGGGAYLLIGGRDYSGSEIRNARKTGSAFMGPLESTEELGLELFKVVGFSTRIIWVTS